MLLNYKNKQFIDEHTEDFHINKFAANFSLNYLVNDSKEDYSGLTIQKAEYSTVIHSLFYPYKESQKSVDLFVSETNTIIVFGLGLAYHIRLLKEKYPHKRLMVLEPDKFFFNYICNYLDLSELSGIEFYIGYSDYDLAKLLSIKEFDIFYLKAYVKLHNNIFSLYEKRLFNQGLYALSDIWKYKKFQNEQLHIIFIDSSYVLTKECLSAIQNNGHKVHYVHIDNESYDYELFIRNLMNDIAHFKPDFILTVNHLGFDKEGRLTQLLTEMEMPFVSWFVDSPNIILSCFDQNISDLCNIFVWDRDYIADVKQAGYPHVDYLPLASSLELFYHKPANYTYDISFVGSSMVYATHKNMRSFSHRPDLLKLLEISSDKFLDLKSRYVSEAIEVLKAENHIFNFEDTDQKEDFEAAVLWRSTQRYRLSGLLKLEAFKTTISGDPNWPRLLPAEFNILGERFYYQDLIDFYNTSKINFNMTSLQMKNAVNQRVFDVPACKQFLLTDYKQQLNEIYDCKTDIVVFNHIDEIPDLISFYLKHDQLRSKMAGNAYLKVKDKHSYEHRLQTMIEILRNRYKS